ncbi:MAG: restriction endonuclease subunit S [Rhodobacteraceae bacterium]|nr:restriction endonuclease subunit S [Paracoccaceae bacterium]
MTAKWRDTTLGDIAEIVSGATPKTSVEQYWGGGVPWVTPADLSGIEGVYIDSTARTLTTAGLKSCASRLLPTNSVLLSSRAPIGLVAINTVPMATNQGFKSLVPDNSQVDSKFLFWWLRRHRVQLEAMGNGATFKEVSKRIVASVPISLPPVEEQLRIAAVLDAAAALRWKRQQALTKLHSLSRAIFIGMFGDAVSKDSEWPVRCLAEVVEEGTTVTYGIVQAGNEFPGGVPYIRSCDIVDGRIQVEGLRRTDPDIERNYPRSRIRAGEVVMSIRATVGPTALVPDELDGSNLARAIARISPDDGVDGTYLLEYLRSDTAQRWIQKQVKGATFREITLKRLRELPVLVPPLGLQQEFAETCRKACQLRNSLEDSLDQLDGLFASIQQRAFRGEL